jgi:hypothetical protein
MTPNDLSGAGEIERQADHRQDRRTVKAQAQWPKSKSWIAAISEHRSDRWQCPLGRQTGWTIAALVTKCRRTEPLPSAEGSVLRDPGTDAVEIRIGIGQRQGRIE